MNGGLPGGRVVNSGASPRTPNGDERGEPTTSYHAASMGSPSGKDPDRDPPPSTMVRRERDSVAAGEQRAGSPRGGAVSARTKLGSWVCPSGNGVDVFLEPASGEDIRRVMCAWDTAPPLSEVDYVYYSALILPTIVRRVQEYLERPCRAAVVVL